jgi:twitching motility protein PilT
LNLEPLLRYAAGKGASDLHLKAGSFPLVRLQGRLTTVPDTRRLEPSDTARFAEILLSPAQQRRFEDAFELDFAHEAPGIGRFRCSVFRQRGSVGLVMRVVQTGIRSIGELQLPKVIERIAEEPRGLVLVTGTTTSGKSTTLAAMIGHINRTRAAHIITIEDPIEYLHHDDQSVVTQREIAFDTRSFSHALRAALRQDPDVIMVGEMRDSETIETALLAAETGHLVLSTLHTIDATETVNRIIAAFPTEQQRQIRLQLANELRAVISMRLLRRADESGRVPAAEILIGTPYVRDCIGDPDKTSLIPDAIASGQHPYGMQTFDQSILGLYHGGLVTREEALLRASNVAEFQLKLDGVHTTADLGRGPADAPVEVRPEPEILRFGG